VNELKPIPFVSYQLHRRVTPAGTVVDLGCGPDRYRAPLAPARYVGIDITADDYRPGMPRQVDIVASARQLPLADSSADLVFSVSAFHLFPDPPTVLGEIRRILKPGGQVLLFDYNRRTQRRLAAAEKRVLPCWTQLQLRRLVAQAGFDRCEVLTPLDRPVAAPLRWLRLLAQEWFGTWAIVAGQKPAGVLRRP
jgi:SAM-dependent methyltransferase